MKLLLALQLCNTMFTSEVLVQQHGAADCNIIARCRDSLVAYWMKAMIQMLPSVHNKSNKHSPFCTHCGQGGSQKESLPHFLSTCPKFCLGRRAAHNQVCKVLTASLHKHLAAHLSLYLEILLSQTGLVLELVPHCNSTATRKACLRFRHCSFTNKSWTMANLILWQYPTGTYPNKKIVIGPEVCRLSETRTANLFEPRGRNFLLERCRQTNLLEQDFKIHCLRMDSLCPSMSHEFS